MIDFLRQIYPVDYDVLEEYKAHCKDYSLPKKTIMTAEGDTERYMY